jgi:hypothetical protein
MTNTEAPDYEKLDLYDTLARLRDHLYGAAEDLDKLVQTKAKAVTKDYDSEKIQWVKKTGQKGEYEFADPKTEGQKPDFKALAADLREHKGKFQRGGSFYWLFSDSNAIGRKPARK